MKLRCSLSELLPGIAEALLHIFDTRAYMSVDLWELKVGDI